MELSELTMQLLKECEICKRRFLEKREKNEEADFFQEVKPYADSVQQMLLIWKETVIQWVNENQPRYFHNQQIESVVDNMNQFVVQSFFKETSKKRFLQSIHSVQYTLTVLLRYLKEKNE